MTLWYHLRCGAYKRPEVFLEAVETVSARIPDQDELIAAARLGMEHRRLPRINGLERSPTGRARCRGCRELIAKDTWRIPLVFYDQGFFNPSGFMHLACAKKYLGTTDIEDRLAHFGRVLDPEDLEEVRGVLSG